jgi:NAD(P)-dependent dehydrogenase (short-subunit alcohol dehydrogenase family)
MQPLVHRVALVTGGGRGIGRATALELARLGAAVAVLARSSDQVATVAAEISAHGGRALALSADVADGAAVQAAVDAVERALGPIDILINNAAVLEPLGPTATSDPEAWARAIAINVVGAYRCLRAVLPGMLERRWGRIVNVSSGAATGSGILNASAYSTSKAALDMLTRAVAAEIASSGVTVNALHPGMVDTAMQTTLRTAPIDQIGAATSARFRGAYERGELRDPAEPARLIAAIVLSDAQGEIVSIRDQRAQELLRMLPGYEPG